MDFPGEFKPYLIGRWMGGNSFSDYTEVDIFMKGDVHYFRRVNLMPGTVLEGPMHWDSAQRFHTSIPLWTQVGNVDVRGMCCDSPTGQVLELEFENDGMGGAEAAYIIKMTRDGTNYEKFQTATSQKHSPVLSSSVFPVGNATDINLTALQLASAVSELLVPNTKHIGLRADGIMLLKDGKVIVESYQWGMDAHSIHLVASVTKSIVGIVIGIAIDKGHVALSDVVSDAFPELKGESSWGNDPPITLHHALCMTSGTRFGDLETQKLLGSSCVEELILSTPRLQSPGERFRYDNGLSTILALFLERKTGMSFEKFTEKYFFGPLQITYRWSHLRQASVDGNPLVLTSGGLFLTVPDMAKIGQLMLEGGVYHGKRVLSEQYIKLAVTQHSPKGFFPYGYHWHLNTGLRHFGKWEDAYMALGAGENVICVIPSQQIVFVAACSSWTWPSLTPPVLETLCKTVLKELDKGSGRL